MDITHKELEREQIARRGISEDYPNGEIMRSKAIEKIKKTPKITEELRYGGCLLFDKNTGGIFHCCEDGKTYYQRWDDKLQQFALIDWRCGGLDKYDLQVLDREEYIKPKYVKPELKTRELSAKENLLKSHIVGIHDTRVGTGAWKPEGFAIFKRAKSEYYFVSWHSGRDPGIADYNEVRKWVKMNREHHG